MIADRMISSLEGEGGIRQAYNEAQRQYKIYGRERVFDLSLGNPSAPAPQKVKEAVLKTLEGQGFTHGYMNNAGFLDVREKIAASINRREHTMYSSDALVMTSGVAGGLSILMCSLINPGDEVVVFAPFYTSYRSFVENWGGRIVIVGPKGKDFLPDYQELAEKISPKTKIVIVNSPHNPTGTIYTDEVAEKLSAILEEKQKEYSTEIYLISDESYRDLVYDGTNLPWWPNYYDNTVVSYSFSKSLSLAGERIGYILIPKELADSEQLIQATKASLGRIGYVNAPALFQKVVGQCVDEKVDLEYYAGNRRILYDALDEAGFEFVEPRGAFYFYVKCPIAEIEFIEKAKKLHLIMVGGSYFGYGGYVRLSFCCERKVLKGAGKVLKRLASECEL